MPAERVVPAADRIMKNVQQIALIACFAGGIAAWIAARPVALHSQAPGAAQDSPLQQIQQAIQSGHLEEAREEVDSMLKEQPQDERLYNFLGVIDAQSRDFAGAERAFSRAIELAPRFTGAYLNLGRLYQEHAATDPHSRENALRLYQRLLGFEPDNVEANYQAAWLSNQLGEFSSSQRYLNRLPAATRARTQVLALRLADSIALVQDRQATTECTELLGREDLAREDIDTVAAALAAHPSNAVALLFLEGAARRDMASPAVLMQLAALYDAGHRYKDAEAILERAFLTAPESAEILFQLGRVAYDSGDRQGALGYLAHARDLDPKNAAVHFFFGMICVEMDLLPDAKKSLEEAVQLNPENAFYNYALGAVLIQANNSDEAARYFEKFQTLRPQDPRGKLALGVAYFYSFRYDDARRELQLVAGRPEMRAGAELFLGRMDLRDGKLDEAAAHFDASLAADPSICDAYAELGMVYIDKKDYASAESALLKAVKISPNDYLSNERLLTVYLRTKDPRADEQAKKVETIRKSGQDKERLLTRTLEIRPN